MGTDLVTLIGPGAVTVLSVALLQGAWKWRENRTTLRRGRDITDAQWNHAYRRGAEAHLVWDGEMLQVNREMMYEINQLRMENGKPPRQFSLLRTPPPLFPTLEVAGEHE